MGSGNMKEENYFKQLIERPLGKEACVMIGNQTPLRNFKCTPQRNIIIMKYCCCMKCSRHYAHNSIWFFLDDNISVCFACYTRRRIPFILLHRFLSRLVLQELPKELRECTMDDNISIYFGIVSDAIRLNPLCLIFPYIQYNLVKNLDTGFTKGFSCSYLFYLIDKSLKARCCVTIDYKNKQKVFCIQQNLCFSQSTLYYNTKDYLVMLKYLNSITAENLIFFDFK